MTEQVARNYGKGGSPDRIRAAPVPVPAGKDLDHPVLGNPAPVDEFRSRRRLATEVLALQAKVAFL